MLFKMADCSVLDITQSATMEKNSDTVKHGEWEFTKKPGMLYVVARAVTANVPNGNGDLFSYEEIKQAYKTFIGKGVFVNHASTDPEKLRGKIIDSKLIDDDKNDIYVKCLLEINAQAFPELAQMIKCGHQTDFSMGANIKYSNCSICFNKAATTREYCALPKTKVTMHDGTQKNIEEIQVGDLVLSAYGTVDEVIELKQRYVEEDIVELKFTGKKGKSYFTKEHPLLGFKNSWGKCYKCRTPKSCTHKKFSERNPMFVPVDFLDVNDYVLAPANLPNLESIIDPLLVELVGYFAAEGSYVRDKNGQVKYMEFSLHQERETIATRIICISEKLFNYTPKVYRTKNSQGISVRINNREASQIVFEYCQGLAKDKKVTEKIFYGNRESQIKFLSAVIDGDGYYDIYHNAIIFKSKSKNLSNQVAKIAENLGYFTKTHSYVQIGGPTNRTRTFWINSVCITQPFEESLGFGKLKKISQLKSPDALSIFKIQENIAFRVKEKTYKPYSGYVYNIETKETHSYLANDIGSHNCMHIKMHKGGVYNGKPVYEDNHGIEFIELSIVSRGADSTAKTLEVLARKNGWDLKNVLQKAAASSTDPNFIENLQNGNNFDIDKVVLAGIRRANEIRGK